MFEIKENFINHYRIQKKLKFLIEVTIDTDGSFSVGQKLSNVLNQNGLYENDLIQQYVKDFFLKIVVNIEIEEPLVFLVPIIFIFPKKKQKTYIYIINPFSNNFFMKILKLNFIDFYFYLKQKMTDTYLSPSYYITIKKYLEIYYFFRKKRDQFYIKKLNYYFLIKKKKNS